MQATETSSKKALSTHRACKPPQVKMSDGWILKEKRERKKKERKEEKVKGYREEPKI